MTQHAFVAACGLLAGAAAAAAAQIPAPREFRHQELIVTGYHEPSGYGSVELKPVPLEGAEETALTAMFRYRGRALAAPPAEVRVVIVSAASGAARYAAVKRVVFEPDGGGGGAAVTVPVTLRAVDSSTGRAREQLFLKVPSRDFLRVVSAGRAVVRLPGASAGARLALGETQLEALKDFASRMAPAAHAAAAARQGGALATTPLVERAGVYLSNQVERRAVQRGALVPPRYPAQLPVGVRDRRVVVVEFVVDSTGTPEAGTLLGHAARDSLFVQEIGAVLPRWRFTPAVKDGRPVRQTVVHTIPFDPGLTWLSVAVDTTGCGAPAGTFVTVRAYHPEDVERQARLVPAHAAAPDSLAAAAARIASAQRRRVEAVFVVDTVGRVAPCTMHVVATADPQLSALVLRTVPTWRFEPARLRGYKVPQLVEWKFDF